MRAWTTGVVMNLGAGDTRLVEQYGEGIDWHHSDLNYAGNSVDIRNLPCESQCEYNVFTKRVLCCLPAPDRWKAAQEIHRILKPGGLWFLVDVFEPARSALQLAREQAGMFRLPAPRHNFQIQAYEIQDFTRLFGRLEDEHPLAASYLIWTRLHMPMILGQDDPFERVWLRESYPLYSEEVQRKFGFHRIWIFRKT